MLKIRDAMTRDVLTVTPETTLREAAELFVRHHVGGAPVVAGSRVVGVVSTTDVLDFMTSNPVVPSGGHEPQEVDAWGELPEWEAGDTPPAIYFTEAWSDVGSETGERFAERERPEWDALAEHTVGEVMTRKVCSLSSDLPITAAADFMQRAGVHRVLVLDQGKLVGIITSSDVARAAADRKLSERRFVFDRSQADHERRAGGT